MSKYTFKRNNMNRVIRCTLLPLILAAFFATKASAQQPPTEDVSAKVLTLWTGNQISDLTTYLSPITTTYPNYVPAILASAFYDYVFTGNMNQAVQKLQSIKSDTQTNTQAYTDAFKTRLDEQIRQINSDIAYQTNAGRTQAQWQANANPQAVRSFWGVEYHPIIDLGTAAPKIYLGQH